MTIPSADLLLGQRSRRWTNIKPATIYDCWIKQYDLNSLNFHPRKVVSRYRDPQLQVGENYSHLFKLILNISKYWSVNTHLAPDKGDLIG